MGSTKKGRVSSILVSLLITSDIHISLLIFPLQVIAFSESRVTTVMAVGEELWVGLGNGQVLIFDIVKNSSYEDEAYLVLSENEGKTNFL